MAVIVNTNLAALTSQRNLSNSTNSLNTAVTRLSTGSKINNAKDDAAGLFIATGLTTQLRGLEQSRTNISLGTNVLQIAEGDITTIQDNVMRIKDLATQAANGVYSTSARKAMSDEVNARLAEIDRVAGASNFNGMELFSENAISDIRLQVGDGADGEVNSITIDGVFGELAASSTGMHLHGTTLNSMTVDGNAHQLTDKDGNQLSSIEEVFKHSTACAAYIKNCEAAINTLSEKRSKIGVIQSRLEMASAGLTTRIENVSAAKSTIMDTDIATETANYTKNQILQQISASMLTQANQAPSIALSLLG